MKTVRAFKAGDIAYHCPKVIINDAGLPEGRDCVKVRILELDTENKFGYFTVRTIRDSQRNGKTIYQVHYKDLYKIVKSKKTPFEVLKERSQQ